MPGKSGGVAIQDSPARGTAEAARSGASAAAHATAEAARSGASAAAHATAEASRSGGKEAGAAVRRDASAEPRVAGFQPLQPVPADTTDHGRVQTDGETIKQIFK